MSRFLHLLALLTALVASTAAAGPQEDADFIVERTVTRDMFEGAITAQRPVLISAIQFQLQQQGLSLPNPERFFDLYVDEFIGEFTDLMQGETASLYLNTFSEQELADIAAFLKTPSGEAWMAATPTLMIEGAKLGQTMGQRAGANVPARMAQTIKEEGLVVVDDPGLLRQLLDALR